jgi:NinB protein
MSRALLVLNGLADRMKAADWVHKAPPGTRVEFKASKRTLSQNSRFWAMLTDVAEQLPWHGLKLKSDDWKLVFLDALKREVRLVPNIDGTGFVNLGRSSSDLSKEEMGDLMTLIEEFGARHGVVFHNQNEEAA